MPISSLIVQTVTTKVDEVAEAIGNLEGASVTKVEGANIVTLTDTKSREEDQKIWDKLESIPGVIGVSLIYHNFEDVKED